MNYRFHRCQCHAKLPDLQGWYLELRPDDPETVIRIHRSVTGLYYGKFGMDPHVDPTGPYNPIKLAARWLLSVEHYLMAGETVLVNPNGGIMPLEDAHILATVEVDQLVWPTEFADPTETITIARWPEGKHYYLCSSKARLFVPDKHPTFDAAHKAALRYVPAERIKSKC